MRGRTLRASTTITTLEEIISFRAVPDTLTVPADSDGTVHATDVNALPKIRLKVFAGNQERTSEHTYSILTAESSGITGVLEYDPETPAVRALLRITGITLPTGYITIQVKSGTVSRGRIVVSFSLSKRGTQGLQGMIPRQSAFTLGAEYHNDLNLTTSPRFLDLVAYKVQGSVQKPVVYQCVQTHVSTPANKPPHTDYWTEATVQTEFLATRLLLSELIKADDIAAGAITADKLNVSSIQAISEEVKAGIQIGGANYCKHTVNPFVINDDLDFGTTPNVDTGYFVSDYLSGRSSRISFDAQVSYRGGLLNKASLALYANREYHTIHTFQSGIGSVMHVSLAFQMPLFSGDAELYLVTTNVTLGAFHISRMMVEEGNMETSWSQSRLDLTTDTRNLLLESMGPYTTDSTPLIRMMISSVQLVAGKCYTIVMNGSTDPEKGISLFAAGGSTMDANALALDVIPKGASNLTHSASFLYRGPTVGSASFMLRFIKSPASPATGSATLHWACLYEGDKAPLTWFSAPEDLPTKQNLVATINLSKDKIDITGCTSFNNNVIIHPDGKIEAVDGTFSGIINALSGLIGGFEINDESIIARDKETGLPNLYITPKPISSIGEINEGYRYEELSGNLTANSLSVSFFDTDKDTTGMVVSVTDILSGIGHLKFNSRFTLNVTPLDQSGSFFPYFVNLAYTIGLYRKVGTAYVFVKKITDSGISESVPYRSSFRFDLPHSTYIEAEGTYKIELTVYRLGSYDPIPNRYFRMECSTGIITLQNLPSATLIGSNGITSYWGTDKYMAFDKVNGFECVQGKYGLGITESGIRIKRNGIWANL